MTNEKRELLKDEIVALVREFVNRDVGLSLGIIIKALKDAEFEISCLPIIFPFSD